MSTTTPKTYPTTKCPTCGGPKRRLYEYVTKFGDKKDICQNCLMIHNLFDDICEFNTEKDADIFAKLNSFYSYKSYAKEQSLVKLVLRYLWQMKQPNLTQIEKLWVRHYKNDPIMDYVNRFKKIGIFGNIIEEEGEKILEWGSKMNMLIAKFADAQSKGEVNNWYFDISNIIKSLESLVGLSTEIDRTNFDKNRNAIMKMFISECCDSDGKIKNTLKFFDSLEKGGYICRHVDEKGDKCKLKFDNMPDIFDHLDSHGISKEDKEDFVEKLSIFKGVWLNPDAISSQSDKVSYTNWQNLISRAIKDGDFFTYAHNKENGRAEFLIDPDVATAMEKAIIKTKELIKDKSKIKSQK